LLLLLLLLLPLPTATPSCYPAAAAATAYCYALVLPCCCCCHCLLLRATTTLLLPPQLLTNQPPNNQPPNRLRLSQDDFFQQHGHAPKGSAQRAPLASAYAQYREWKRNIRDHAASHLQAWWLGCVVRAARRASAPGGAAASGDGEAENTAPAGAAGKARMDEQAEHTRLFAKKREIKNRLKVRVACGGSCGWVPC